MKKIYLGALALAVGFSATAQSKLGLNTQNLRTPETTSKTVVDKSEAYQKAKKAAFWSEDFSNGFAGQGTNGAWTQKALPSSNGAVPFWEYRGPATTPSNATGSQGSCGGVAPLASTTTANGFVIFDSNGLDEPTPNPCAGTGVGPAPSPHNATLYTPSIDFSSETSVQLFFEVNARNFQATVKIDVIADGDTSKAVGEVFALLDLGANTATGNGDIVGIDITEWAAGHTDVKVGFNFDGDYYYFMMDDVFFDAVPDYDYNIDVVYNDDITDWYEYNHLPLSQTHLLQPGMRINSFGTQPVDLTMEITITEPDGAVQGPFTQTFADFPRDSTSANTFIDTYVPSKIGTHTITYKVTSPNDANDFNPANNTRTRTFILSNQIWSDAFSASAASFRAPEVDGAPGESEGIQTYHTFNQEMIYGIDYLIINSATAPDEATFDGDEIQVSLYSLDKDAYAAGLVPGADFKKSEIFTEIQSDFITVADSMISTGTLRIQTHAFAAPSTIAADQLFAISIYNSGGGYLRIATTSPGTNSDGSGLVRARGLLADPSAVDDDELLQFSNVNPWIRARTTSPIGVSENDITSLIGNASPNPSNGLVTVAYTLLNTSNVSLTLTDLSGKVIATQNEGTKNTGVNKLTFDVSSLDAGVYFYSVTINGATATKKLVVTK